MTALLAFLVAGCNPKVALPPPAPAQATLISLETSAVTTADKETILRVVATAAARPCFEALLLRAPTAYGEVLVAFTIAPTGRVSSSRPQFGTLGDPEAEQCIADAVAAVAFPTRDIEITVLYPFLLLTERTPPEVARSLRDRYGLLTEAERHPGSAPDDLPPPGVVVVW
jgi:hypothetical protein